MFIYIYGRMHAIQKSYGTASCPFLINSTICSHITSQFLWMFLHNKHEFLFSNLFYFLYTSLLSLSNSIHSIVHLFLIPIVHLSAVKIIAVFFFQKKTKQKKNWIITLINLANSNCENATTTVVLKTIRLLDVYGHQWNMSFLMYIFAWSIWFLR